ncbi:MAG: twin-arginine translocase subunit TatC [Mucilaginibacter sp.]|uniref:twin-arginine translocase subunit TatC n=1 Tax=Mucilaginibacter sp. TaxID=1882438 RepID=UPI0034E5E6E8
MSDLKDNKLFKALKNKGTNLESEMSFFDHLDALRGHLVRSAIAIIVITGFVFAYYDWIFANIIMGPSNEDFWTYRTMCNVGNALGRNFCFSKFNISLINTEMAGQFTLQINSSLMIGLTLGVPYLLWEIWRFIKPALLEKERKAAGGFVFYTSILFFIGVLFGYYVITPMSLHFLATYTVSSRIQNLFDIDSYISSVATLTIASGLVFELPMLIYVLATVGIMTPKFMRESRRYAIVIILIIAAVVTPTPDMLTMTIVSIPLFILYEASIFVAAGVERSRNKKHDQLMAS